MSEHLTYFVYATFERRPEEIPVGNWVHDLPFICREHKAWGRRSGMFYKACGDIVTLRVEERPYAQGQEPVFSERTLNQRDMRCLAREERGLKTLPKYDKETPLNTTPAFVLS